MKMYEVLALQNFFTAVADKKLPIKTAYKLNRLARQVEEEIQFYQKEFRMIVNEYAKKENGQYVYSPDGTSIEVVDGKDDECNAKLFELKTLEVEIKDIEFSIEEFENLNLTLAEMDAIFPLIKN